MTPVRDWSPFFQLSKQRNPCLLLSSVFAPPPSPTSPYPGLSIWQVDVLSIIARIEAGEGGGAIFNYIKNSMVFLHLLFFHTKGISLMNFPKSTVLGQSVSVHLVSDPSIRGHLFDNFHSHLMYDQYSFFCNCATRHFKFGIYTVDPQKMHANPEKANCQC